MYTAFSFCFLTLCFLKVYALWIVYAECCCLASTQKPVMAVWRAHPTKWYSDNHFIVVTCTNFFFFSMCKVSCISFSSLMHLSDRLKYLCIYRFYLEYPDFSINVVLNLFRVDLSHGCIPILAHEFWQVKANKGSLFFLMLCQGNYFNTYIILKKKKIISHWNLLLLKVDCFFPNHTLSIQFQEI